MTDDTRDIAIATRSDVQHLSKEVAKLTETVSGLKEAMVERRGAEKVARWIIGGTAGGVGALITKFGTALLNTPLPK